MQFDWINFEIEPIKLHNFIFQLSWAPQSWSHLKKVFISMAPVTKNWDYLQLFSSNLGLSEFEIELSSSLHVQLILVLRAKSYMVELKSIKCLFKYFIYPDKCTFFFMVKKREIKQGLYTRFLHKMNGSFCSLTTH